MTSWNALFTPAGTPAPVVTRLQSALAEVLADADIKRKLLELGIEARAVGGADLSRRLEADIAKWGDVIQKAGIQKN